MSSVRPSNGARPTTSQLMRRAQRVISAISRPSTDGSRPLSSEPSSSGPRCRGKERTTKPVMRRGGLAQAVRAASGHSAMHGRADMTRPGRRWSDLARPLDARRREQHGSLYQLGRRSLSRSMSASPMRERRGSVIGAPKGGRGRCAYRRAASAALAHRGKGDFSAN